MGFSSCRQKPWEYVKCVRAKIVQKSACAIEKAQHLNKNHQTIQNFNKI
jgi:hypothetical protein